MVKVTSCLKVLFVAPFYGHTGYAVNERQLALSLSRHVGSIYVLTLIGLKQFVTWRRSELKIDVPRNMKVFILPCPYLFLLDLFKTVLISFAFAFFAWFLKTLGIINSIYVRDDLEALGFISTRSLARITLVKLADFEGDLERKTVVILNWISKSIEQNIHLKANRLVLTKAGRVCVNSETFRKQLIARRGFPIRTPIIVISPGVDMETIRRLKSEVQMLPSSEIRIGFIGELCPFQGVDLLVESMAIVSRQFPKTRLYVVGGGEMSEILKQKCISLNLQHAFPGLVTHERALKLLSTFYALVLPSRKDSTTDSHIPIKIIEAWALGVPVIVTKHRVLGEKFVDGIDLIFCKTEAKDIADKILLLLNNPQLKSSLMERGTRLAEEFDYEDIAHRLAKEMGGLRAHSPLIPLLELTSLGCSSGGLQD